MFRLKHKSIIGFYNHNPSTELYSGYIPGIDSVSKPLEFHGTTFDEMVSNFSHKVEKVIELFGLSGIQYNTNTKIEINIPAQTNIEIENLRAKLKMSKEDIILMMIEDWLNG